MPKNRINILIFSALISFQIDAQTVTVPDFVFGNVSYFNLSAGEKLLFDHVEIEITGIENHYTQLLVDGNPFELKVARQSPAVRIASLKIFAADNKAVRSLSGESPVHGLLKKDVLLAVAPAHLPLLDKDIYAFPVSLTNGYIWNTTGDTYMFSYMPAQMPRKTEGYTYAGIGFDMTNIRSENTHSIVAVENGKAVWVETAPDGVGAAVCIESQANRGIFYVYENLNAGNIQIRKNQFVEKETVIGYAQGEKLRNTFRINIVYSDTIPAYAGRHANTVNCMPQMLDIYYLNRPVYPSYFTKGQIHFGHADRLYRNAKNISEFEEHTGAGWKLGKWNTAQKTEWTNRGEKGNARLRKTLFAGQPAQCTNPHNYYEFEINVKNGLYRIRALVGDLDFPTQQKIEFEGVDMGVYTCAAGEYKWTAERIVKVEDRKLTIRIYVDDDKIAGVSEIVFQQTRY